MSGGRRPLIAGNWKMHLTHLEGLALVQKLAFSLDAEQLAAVEVVLFPPFTAIRSVQSLVEGDRLLLEYGAQDLAAFPDGPRTGDVSGSMIAALGCRYALVGHSERRRDHDESDATVHDKLRMALEHGLAPMLCVGEMLPVREAGRQVEHCVAQLDSALEGLSAEQLTDLVVAYEPVWAIGTGKVAHPEDAQEVNAALRARVGELLGPAAAAALRILYGGSVKAVHVEGIMAQPDVDGALVGSSSLDADEFAAICRYAVPTTG